MKKLLALVLALVMTLGLATVSASAASYKVKYDDATSIDYKEAADVLSAVGVFNGKGSNFAPKDNLNRGEAAKLVAYLMLGNKTAESIKGNGNKFADVPADHFAAGYIEYLATAGVVSGVGGGNFNPNGPVTVVQFAKMLSVALGYDAQVEGYVGESWNINIMKQANDDELFKTLNVNSNDVLTREQAAQMCLNALKANTVEYESKGDILTLNNSTVVLNAKKAHDKTSSADKAKKINGDLLNNGNTSVLQLGEDLYNGDLELRKVGDDFNRPANKWIYKMEEIGTYVNTSDLKAEYHDEIKRGPLYDLVGKSVYDNLVNGDALLEYYEDGVGGPVNYQLTKADRTAAVENYIQKNGDKAINSGNSSGRGSLTQVFVDKDDHTTITVINSYVYQASSDYRTSTEDLVISVPTDAKNQANANEAVNLDTTRLELEDFPMIKDVKKDEYLILTAYKNGGATYTPKTAVKGELLTGKVEKVVVGDSVTIDGTTYKYEKTATAAIKGNEFSVGQETTVVLDPYGYIVYVDEAVVADNYVFISELFQNGGSTSKVQANAYFTDGTNADITIKEIAGSSDKTALVSKKDGTTKADKDKVTGVVNNEQGYVGWYTYSKNSANEYTLNKLGSNYSTRVEDMTTALTKNEELIKSDTVKFVISDKTNPNTNTYRFADATTTAAQANDKTIMVVTYKDKTDVDVYTGVKNIPDITLLDNDDDTKDGKAVIFSAIKSGYAKYVFVSLEGNYNSFGSENENLLYILKYDNMNKISDNKNYYTYKALDENAKDIVIEAENTLNGYDGSSTAKTNVYTAYYKTSKNSDGRYTRAQALPTDTTNTKYFAGKGNTGNTNEKIVADNGTLQIAGQSFTLAKDYRLISVSRSDVLNKKQTGDKEYEANVITAETLESMVSNYDVSYTIQAKLDDYYKAKNGGKIVEAYVTFDTDAVPAGTGSSSSSSNTSVGPVAVILSDNIRTGAYKTAGIQDSDFTVYVAGPITPDEDLVAAMINHELTKYGADLKVKYTPTYDAAGNVNNRYFTISDKSGISVYDRTYTMAAPGDDVKIALVDKVLSYTDSTATYSDSDIDKVAEKTLVVQEGTKVTINASTSKIENLVVAGQLEIASGAIVNVKTFNQSKSSTFKLTKGQLTVNNAPAVIDGSNTFVVAADNSNKVEFKMGAKLFGTMTVNGGSVDVTGNIEAKDGAKITVSNAALAASGTIKVESGATLAVTGTSALSANTVENKNTSASAVSIATTVSADVDNVSGPVTVGNNAYTKDEASDAKEAMKTGLTLKMPTNTKNVVEYSVTNGVTTTKDAHVYTINKDATTITIKVTNKNEKSAISGTLSLTDLTYGTKDKSINVEISAKGSKTYTLTIDEKATKPEVSGKIDVKSEEPTNPQVG